MHNRAMYLPHEFISCLNCSYRLCEINDLQINASGFEWAHNVH